MKAYHGVTFAINKKKYHNIKERGETTKCDEIKYAKNYSRNHKQCEIKNL